MFFQNFQPFSWEVWGIFQLYMPIENGLNQYKILLNFRLKIHNFVVKYLSLVALASNKVIVRSDKTFFSHKLYSNCSEISVGRKVSGSLKLSLVDEFDKIWFPGAAAGKAWSESDEASLKLQVASDTEIYNSPDVKGKWKRHHTLRRDIAYVWALLEEGKSGEWFPPALLVSPGWTSHSAKTLSQMKSRQTSCKLLGDSNILQGIYIHTSQILPLLHHSGY